MSYVRKSTLSTRNVKRDKMKKHVGITLCNSMSEFRWEIGRGRCTHYPGEQIRGTIVVQFVLEQRYLSEEKDGVLTRQFGKIDCVRRIIWVRWLPLN